MSSSSSANSRASDVDEFSFNPEFQLKIAGMLVKNPMFYRDYIGSIEPLFFTESPVSSVIGTLKSYYKKYRDFPDRGSFIEYYSMLEPDVEKQEAFAERAERLYEVDVGKAEVFTRERLSQFLVHSALRQAIEESIDDISAGNIGNELVKRFSEALRAGDVNDSNGKTFHEHAREIVRSESSPDRRNHVSTGLPHLDESMGGGLRPGELGVLMGLPKGFKSGTLMNIGWGANMRNMNNSGLRCDYFTLELSEELQLLRYAIRTASMGRDEMLLNPDKFLRVMDKRQRLYFKGEGDEFRVKFMPPYVCTPSHIRAHLDRQLEEGKKLGVVCVDYLDLMGTDTKKEHDYLEKVQITTDLRQIAIDYQVPVWTAVRTTRDAVGTKRINMKHMSGAFERISVADYVYALCFTEEEKLNGRMRIVPVASRNDGGDRVIECDWRPRIMMIRSLESRELTEDEIEGGEGGSSRKRDESARSGKKNRAADQLKEMVDNSRKKLDEAKKIAAEKRAEAAAAYGGD